MKSSWKAPTPTPEREGSVLQAKEKQSVGFVQKKHKKVYGQLCNASRVPSGIPTIKRDRLAR